jgi:hypothetical protein
MPASITGSLPGFGLSLAANQPRLSGGFHLRVKLGTLAPGLLAHLLVLDSFAFQIRVDGGTVREVVFDRSAYLIQAERPERFAIPMFDSPRR